MLQKLIATGLSILERIDPGPTLGQASDCFSGRTLPAAENVGLSISYITDSLVACHGMAVPSIVPVSEFPFKVERSERVTSGRIIRTSALINGSQRSAIMNDLATQSRENSGRPISIPDLATLVPKP